MNHAYSYEIAVGRIMGYPYRVHHCTDRIQWPSNLSLYGILSLCVELRVLTGGLKNDTVFVISSNDDVEPFSHASILYLVCNLCTR